MKLIEPSFEILEQEDTLKGMLKHIELCGRLAYKSEDKITEESYSKFIDMLTRKQHLSPLEHGTVTLKVVIPHGSSTEIITRYEKNPYSNVVYWENSKYTYAYIVTNYRVIIENYWNNDLVYFDWNNNDTSIFDNIRFCKRFSVKFTCSRAISHELVRHRVFSFIQESQRYCNYSKDKYNNEITFIKPLWLKSDVNHIDTTKGFGVKPGEELLIYLAKAEQGYMYLLDNDLKPQEAREILPNATKTEIIMTGFDYQWRDFFNLRCDKAAHPEMRRLTIPLKEELIKRKLILE